MDIVRVLPCSLGVREALGGGVHMSQTAEGDQTTLGSTWLITASGRV